MGKKHTQKDRLYLTNKEYKEEHGGYKGAEAIPFAQLPFNCCALSFTPFDDPVCTLDGSVFDILHIVPYIQKFHKHPITGEPLALSDLVSLHFHKNADDEFACPVLHKVFTPHSHIVAIKTSGHVYCYEAIEELNLKTRNLRDLLTDEPFTKADVIHLQNPHVTRDVASFDHVKKNLRASEEEKQVLRTENLSDGLKRTLAALQDASTRQEALAKGGGGKRAEALRLLMDAQLERGGGGKGGTGKEETKNMDAPPTTQPPPPTTTTTAPDPRLQAPQRLDIAASFRPGTATWNSDAPTRSEQRTATAATFARDARLARVKALFAERSTYHESNYSTGRGSHALTSTAMPASGRNELISTRIQRKPKKKGYVRMSTNVGDLNLELDCDVVPMTCENFLILAEAGYYNDTIFHRSIKNFMIQGGDPTGTGKGGESIYGPTFADELDARLTHHERGILSMANSGPHTNGSQFFILYKSAHHLNQKHAVFGRVVGGMETLRRMESIPTDKEDVPLEEIRIVKMEIFVDPFREELEAERKKEAEKREASHQARRHEEERGPWFSDPAAAAATAAAAAAKKASHAATVGSAPYAAAIQPTKTGVGRYLSIPSTAAPLPKDKEEQDDQPEPPPAKKAKTTNYGNFDGW